MEPTLASALTRLRCARFIRRAVRQKKKSFLTTVLQRFLGNQHG